MPFLSIVKLPCKYQRKLLGLAEIPEKKAVQENTMSAVFGRKGPVPAQERIDLVVPYPDPPEARKEAKEAGARWDGKVWYVPEGFDLTLVERWLPKDRDWEMYGLI